MGAPIGRASGPLAVTRITGPVEQTGPDAWAISFNRLGFDAPKRANDMWLLASHPNPLQKRRAAGQYALPAAQ